MGLVLVCVFFFSFLLVVVWWQFLVILDDGFWKFLCVCVLFSHGGSYGSSFLWLVAISCCLRWVWWLVWWW